MATAEVKAKVNEKGDRPAGPIVGQAKPVQKLPPHKALGVSYYIERLYPGDQVRRFMEIFAAVLTGRLYLSSLAKKAARAGAFRKTGHTPSLPWAGARGKPSSLLARHRTWGRSGGGTSAL